MIYMLHHNKTHKLIVLNQKDKSRLWADLTLKRQIEYLKDTFCIAYRNGYKNVFKGEGFPDFLCYKRKCSSTIIVAYTIQLFRKVEVSAYQHIDNIFMLV